MARCMDLALLIMTNKKSACLSRAGCINYSRSGKEVVHMSYRVNGIFNQILSADEIVLGLNHNGIYNTQNSQQTLFVRIYS